MPHEMDLPRVILAIISSVVTPEKWSTIERLFEESAALPAERRGAFLTAETDDPEIRAHVEKLLAADESSDDFIEGSIWTDKSVMNTGARKAISNSLGDSAEYAVPDEHIGRQIGAFRLIKEIGRGGMGSVYLAERSDGEFRQKVAVKMIKRGMDSDFIIRRFRHERQILASFEHPNIARLLDGGTTSEGVPFFVMEYVDGESLYRYCDAKGMTVRQRLELFLQICSSLEYAHAKKVIHRDIKPGNILIDRQGSPKLLDFGIAKILDPNLIHESLNPTVSMLRMMTPDYASPEQMQGVEVTPASDIFSLGILLYELLTGHRPHVFTGRALHEVSRIVCEVMPAPPSAILERDDHLLTIYTETPSDVARMRSISPSLLAETLRGGIDNIVMKAIAKDPRKRYRSVADLAGDIERHLAGAQVQAPTFAPSENGSGILRRLPENTKAVAVLPFRYINLGSADDTDDRFLGLGLADALITRLSKIRRFVVRPTSSIRSFGEEHLDPIEAGRVLKADYILDGTIKKANNRLRVTVQLLDVSANAAIWATSIDETLSDVLTLEDTLSTKMIEVLLPQLTGGELEDFVKRGTDVPEAFEHYIRGRYHFNSFTEEGLAQAFVSFHKAIAADPNYALAYAGIADYYNWLGIIGVLPPQECYQPAIEAASKAIELDPDLSEGHSSIGFSLHAGNHDWARAEVHLRKALELNPNNAGAYVWYAIVLYTEGRFEEGLNFATRSVDIDPLTPFNHHNIAWGLYYARRFDESIRRYRRVVSDFPNYLFGYYGLSKVYRITGNSDDAMIQHRRADDLMSGSIFSQLSEAECLAVAGQKDAARNKLKALEELSKERFISPYQMALTHCYLNEPAEALTKLEQSLEYREAWLNWMGVEPVFDVVRADPRFAAIQEAIGYRALFEKFAGSGFAHDVSTSEIPHLHERTTIAIDESPQTLGAKGRSRRKRYFVTGVAASVLLAALAFAFLDLDFDLQLSEGRPIASASYQNPSVIVLPFEGSQSTNFNLGVGLSDALTMKLGNIKTLRVISPNTARSAASLEPAAISQELGARFIVKGSITGEPGNESVDASLIDAASGNTLWRETFAPQQDELFGIQTRMAERIWTSLGIDPLPLEIQQVRRSYTDDTEAYELYLIGRYQLTRRSPGDLKQAISTFANAVKKDPQFAPAYIGLADAYLLIKLYDTEAPTDAYALAKQHADRALAIDENISEAYATRAYLKFYADRDRPGAELDFRRSVQLNPSNAQAHHWFALFLSAIGKTDEARDEIENARRLDPRARSVLSAAAMISFFASDAERAVTEADQVLREDPSFVPALKVKRWAFSASVDTRSAAATFTEEISFSGGDAAHPGWQVIAAQVGALGAQREAALKTLRSAARDPQVRDNPYAYAFETGLAFLVLGSIDEAFAEFARAEAAGSHGFNFFEVDPRLRELRRDERFSRLAAMLRSER